MGATFRNNKQIDKIETYSSMNDVLKINLDSVKSYDLQAYLLYNKPYYLSDYNNRLLNSIQKIYDNILRGVK